MATKKIEEYSTPELQKMAKTHKIIFGILIGMFIVYLGLILYLMYLGKSAAINATGLIALLVLFMPINIMRSKVLAELKQRGEAT